MYTYTINIIKEEEEKEEKEEGEEGVGGGESNYKGKWCRGEEK